MKAYSYKTPAELAEELEKEFNGDIQAMADNYNRTTEQIKASINNSIALKSLSSADYVLLDRANNTLLKFEGGGTMIYGDKEEAHNDCYGNEEVISCTDLPNDLKAELTKEINTNN